MSGCIVPIVESLATVFALPACHSHTLTGPSIKCTPVNNDIEIETLSKGVHRVLVILPVRYHCRVFCQCETRRSRGQFPRRGSMSTIAILPQRDTHQPSKTHIVSTSRANSTANFFLNDSGKKYIPPEFFPRVSASSISTFLVQVNFDYESNSISFITATLKRLEKEPSIERSDEPGYSG